jgi:hypothetical protein
MVHDVSDRKHASSNGFSAQAALWVRTLPFMELLLTAPSPEQPFEKVEAAVDAQLNRASSAEC